MVFGNRDMFRWSAWILDARSIHAPEPQKAPSVSVSKSAATSGALPPRIAAVSFVGLVFPVLLTVIHGYFLWNAAKAELSTPSSRAVYGLQNEMVTGSFAARAS